MANIKYFIGNAHLDIAWQWQYREGLSLIKSTYRSALERMEEFPDYVFTSACASYYEWIHDTEPEMFREIASRVREGRWVPIGNMWVQPDCNLPCGESFSRHLLYSERFFLENFGFIPETGYNVDSFGHDGSLPMILRKAGMRNYVYLRPNPENEYPGMTKERLHLWKGNDGSVVTCYHIPDAYCGEVTEERMSLIESPSYPGMYFYGVGNHGGGPTVSMLQAIEKLRKEDPAQYVYGDPENYFRTVADQVPPENLSVVTGDLEHHASGCYSANAKIKKLNRIAEEKLIAAEKYDVMAALLTGSEIHRGAVTEAWKTLCFNQFHDVLAGCTVKEAVEDAYSDFGAVISSSNRIATRALETISFRINTTKYFDHGESVMRDRMWRKSGEGSPLVVFNPHSYPVTALVKTNCNAVTGILDEEDKSLPIQKIRATYTDGPYFNDFIFRAEIPAFGYRTYFLLGEGQEGKTGMVRNPLKVTEHSLENDQVRVLFDEKDGTIREYIDKETGKSFLLPGAGQAVLIEDAKSDTWAHAIFSFPEEIAAFGNPAFEIVEEGPLEAVLRIRTSSGENLLWQDYVLSAGSSSLKVKAKLFFREHHRIVKLKFPVNAENPIARYSCAYGYLDKEPFGLEEPSHKWMDIHDRKTGKGVAILNDCKYSWSADGSTASVIIARGSAFLDHFGQEHRDSSMSYMDQGETEFAYEYCPHDGDDATVVKEANLLNSPLIAIKETHHPGKLPSSCSGMSVSPENVLCEVLKESEDGKGLVLRLYECSGKETEAVMNLALIDAEIRLRFHPLEMKTVYVDRKTHTYREVLLSETDL